MSADPLIKLLGFDPDLEPGEVVEVERIVEVYSPETLEGALRADPRAVLLRALMAIFELAVSDWNESIRLRRAGGHPTGPFGVVREAAFWALKETAHRNRERVPGWIIGKRDDPQK